jgi:hypothetical protein
MRRDGAPNQSAKTAFLLSAFMLATAAISPGTYAQTKAPLTQRVQPGSVPMAEPLRLIAEARQSYQRVADYQCFFIKREVLNRQLQPENVISMTVRTQPFSVYMNWLRPNQLAGQEACYVTGRNNGMMRVHSTRLIGRAGFVSIAPNDPRALQNSRHMITEAGIGNLIEKLAQRWQLENQLNRTQVQIAEYEYDKKRCTRVETIHPDTAGNQIIFYRTIVYFDQVTRLPIRIENYDWPRSPGDRNGMLVESYSYADLRLNVGVSEQVFNR